jgi:hypothetical protein
MGQKRLRVPGPKDQSLDIRGAEGHPPDLGGVKRVPHLDKPRVYPFQKPIKLKPGNISPPGHTDYHISLYHESLDTILIMGYISTIMGV